MPHVTPLHADDPRRVGRYRLTGRLEGMPAAGLVFLARTADGSYVTVTLLDGNWKADGAARDRFTAEANAASRVAPFCAARIVGAGFDGSHAFLVSEYIPGPALLELVAKEGPRNGADLEALAIGTATGLAAIHQAGLVHGDFGPGHVVLGAQGPRVVGFGITPPYGAATPAADMRAWASTVLQAAAGGPADPTVPEDLSLLPEPLRTLALRCASAHPGERVSARSVVVGLLGEENPPAGVLAEGSRRAARAAAEPPPTPAFATDPESPRRPRGRRAVMTWWAAGVVACVLAIAAAVRFAQTQAGAPQATNTSAPGRQAATSPSPRQPTPNPAPAATVPASLAGTWSGRVSQSSPSGPFTVTVQVSLVAGATGGSVRYSGPFSCLDQLTVVSDSPGTIEMDQELVQGPCERGVVTLSPGPAGTLRFKFQGKGAPPATGRLEKM